MSDGQGPVKRVVRARTLYGRGPGPRPCAKGRGGGAVS